jgi:iron complex outermembrane receptor protein
MKIRRFWSWAGAGFITAAWLAGPASADPASNPNPQAGQNSQVGEVVVTAQRREQRNVEVPVSIVSQSARQLERANVTSIMTLSSVVPGLLISRVGAPSAPAIRGVSTKVTSPGQDPNVSTYLDGFYQANSVALNRTLLDVANVEVLRGPQGTLFGRNSTGGAILITTRKPSHTPEMTASASYEQNDGQKYVFYGSTGVTSDLAVSLSASYTRSDGWLKNRAPGLDFPTAPERSNYVRARALYTPTDKLTIDGSYEQGFMEDGTATAPSYYAHPAVAGLFPVLETSPIVTSLNTPSTVKDVWSAGYLTVAYDLGFATLKSLSQIRKDRSPWAFDFDGSPVKVVQISAVYPERMQTQEINLTSKGDGPLQWIVGAFYLHDRSEFIVYSSNVAYGNETAAWAGYADGTLRILPQLFLTAGVRYSEERKHCLDALTGGAYGTLTSCAGGDPIHHESAGTPRANLRFQIDPRTSVYVSYSKGFKSGGFNDATANAPYRPEKLTDWEGGFKTDQGRYSLALSAFHYDYKDLQFAYACTVVSPPICPVAAGTTIINAAKVTSYGAEGQFTWIATSNLRFNGGLAWLHSRYDSFLNAAAAAPTTCANPNQLLCPNVAVAQNWSGQTPIRSPEWSGNVGFEATLPTEVGLFTLDGNVSYVDDYQSDTDSLPCITTNCGLGLKPRLVIPAHTLMDATLSWLAPDRHIEASIYARNLFDKSYIMRTDGSVLGDYVIGGEPRVVGFRVRYTY